MGQVWLKRSDEWIKANPGKGTMYKGYPEKDNSKETISVLVKEARKAAKKDKVDLMDQGIYAIICEITKHVYVGQSMNMGNRMRNHKMCFAGPEFKDNNRTYIKMREHFNEYGIVAFEFKRHLPVLNSNILGDEENKTMYEYMAKGYTLYNTTIPGNLYCSEELRPLMIKIIEAARDELFADKLRELLE